MLPPCPPAALCSLRTRRAQTAGNQRVKIRRKNTAERVSFVRREKEFRPQRKIFFSAESFPPLRSVFPAALGVLISNDLQKWGSGRLLPSAALPPLARPCTPFPRFCLHREREKTWGRVVLTQPHDCRAWRALRCLWAGLTKGRCSRRPWHRPCLRLRRERRSCPSCV